MVSYSDTIVVVSDTKFKHYKLLLIIFYFITLLLIMSTTTKKRGRSGGRRSSSRKQAATVANDSFGAAFGHVAPSLPVADRDNEEDLEG